MKFSMEFHGIPWKFFHEKKIRQIFMKNFMEFHGKLNFPWNCMKISMKFHKIPWKSMEFHETELDEISWNSMEFCEFMEFH
jgi:hypothetical protein